MMTPARLLLSLVASVLLVKAAAGNQTRNSKDSEAIHKPKAKWTIMLYLNGKTDLECLALKSFEELAAVDESRDVKVIVQLGRSGLPCRNEETWSGVRRYFVKKGLRPTLAEACKDVDCPQDDLDMGLADNVKAFVVWAMDRRPADHYMLAVWGHGYGAVLKEELLVSIEVPPSVFADMAEARGISDNPDSNSLEDVQPEGGYGYITADNSFLYVTDLAKALKSAVGSEKIDVLAFDSCLEANIETAYEMRDVARFVVADESLHPAGMWDYSEFLSHLQENHARLAADRVSLLLLQTFKYGYSAWPPSAIRVSRIRDTSHSISRLADALISDGLLGRKGESISVALHASKGFGVYSVKDKVDIESFADGLARRPELSKRIRREAARVETGLRRIKVQKTAGDASTKTLSQGLTIYFPENKRAFDNHAPQENGVYDLSACYRNSDTNRPLSFLCDNNWSAFLAVYLLDNP